MEVADRKIGGKADTNPAVKTGASLGFSAGDNGETKVASFGSVLFQALGYRIKSGPRVLGSTRM
jgi:hypothetical protein